MIDSKDLEKAIVEGIKAIALSGVEKPDTPDIKSIEENNNPEGKVIATSIKVEMTDGSHFETKSWPQPVAGHSPVLLILFLLVLEYVPIDHP